MTTFTMSENVNTTGTHQINTNGNDVFNYRNIPGLSFDAQEWISGVDLDCTPRTAAKEIVRMGLGTVTEKFGGAYGGEKIVVLVNIEKLNKYCEGK